MGNFQDKKKPYGQGGGSSFNREDSRDFGNDRKHSGEDSGERNPFMKDKRPRIHKDTRGEKVERRPRQDFGESGFRDDSRAPRKDYSDKGPRREYDDSQRERRSFNPNFTKDNKPVGRDGDDRGAGRDYSRRYDNRDNRGGRDHEGYRRDDRGGDNRGSGYKSDRYGNEKRDSGSFGGSFYKKSSPYHKDDQRGSSYSPDKPSRYNNDGNRYGDDRRGGNFGEHKEGGYRKSTYGDRKPDTGYGKGGSYGERQDGGYKKQGAYGDRKPGSGYSRGNSYGDRKEGYRKDAAGGKQPYRKKDARPTDYPRFTMPKQVGPMRLNRFIAASGICSRREADDFIQAGVVSVNGQIVTELGTKVSPSDEVRFNDEIIRGEKKVYIVMNKPKGYVTTLEDPHADKTVIDLIKGSCEERVYPVGRLDKNSVGVLLITNDGDMTRTLTHPSSQKKKIYQVSLDKALTQADMKKIMDGIVLEDGEIAADDISYVKDNKKEVGIEIHSGRNRIVRRIFESLGYTVKKLDRVYFAGLTKKGLKRGAWRFLTPLEVSRLHSGEYE